MAHLFVDHVLARTQVRTHTYTHVDSGLNRVSSREYSSSRALVRITSWPNPHVVSLCGVINAFYAIITLAFSIK